MQLPPNAYVYGPCGSGKSAVVTALFATSVRVSSVNNAAIHTTTRVQATFAPRFVYVDARETTSAFAFYHAVLDALVDESVPKQGIKTEALQSRLKDAVEGNAQASSSPSTTSANREHPGPGPR